MLLMESNYWLISTNWTKSKKQHWQDENGVCQVSSKQGLAESNQIFTCSIDGVVNMLVKNFDCCFLRQILTTVMLKIEKYGLRVLIWAEVQPLIDVLLPKSRPWGRISWLWFIKVSVFFCFGVFFSPANCICLSEISKITE